MGAHASATAARLLTRLSRSRRTRRPNPSPSCEPSGGYRNLSGSQRLTWPWSSRLASAGEQDRSDDHTRAHDFDGRRTRRCAGGSGSGVSLSVEPERLLEGLLMSRGFDPIPPCPHQRKSWRQRVRTDAVALRSAGNVQAQCPLAATLQSMGSYGPCRRGIRPSSEANERPRLYRASLWTRARRWQMGRMARVCAG